MMTVQHTQLCWGIISTGSIAIKFVNDLLRDPKTRDVHDVSHNIVAVGSRSVEKAQEFIKEQIPGDGSVKAYGSYTEVFNDKDVDAVYIGTPHTYHYPNALEAIQAKKHVLCEKPVTSNAAELRALIKAAKENNVFFMEAMWTRFQPLTKKVKEIAESGVLGVPIVLHADLSGDFDIDKIPKTHRILDPNLGGGGLLDLGPYPLIWAILALYEHPLNHKAKPSTISGTMLKTPLTNVDSNTSFTLTFSSSSSAPSSELAAQAILTCSINAVNTDPGVTIRYSRGSIAISAPIYSPRSFTVKYHDEKKIGFVEREETWKFDYVGVGWHFQADELARCVRDGKLQSEIWGHDKSLLEMEIFDEVRRQGGYVFPQGVEHIV